MSEIIVCRKVCDDCPLRLGYEDTPDIIVETGWEASGNVSPDRRSASFELRYGKPVGERLSTVVLGVADEEGVRRASKDFQVPGSKLDNGSVVESLDQCTGPYEYRKGIFKIKKALGCSALKSL